jgi:hypothetical protein
MLVPRHWFQRAVRGSCFRQLLGNLLGLCASCPKMASRVLGLLFWIWMGLPLEVCPNVNGAGEVGGREVSSHCGNQLVLSRRSVEQDQGAWVLEYQLRCAGTAGIVIAPGDVKVSVKGWVSNSRVASHAIPRLAQVTVGETLWGSNTGDIIVSTDEAEQCREHVTLLVWTDSTCSRDRSSGAVLSIAPGAKVNVRLRLEHQHVLYGDYDPLLGVQRVSLTIGCNSLEDEVALDREEYVAQAKCGWSDPPVDRRDTRYFLSPPDSLHLEAHIPGHQYYRFADHPVRYGTRLRVRFWYLIAIGTEGECRVRLDEYKDTPTSWRPLASSGFEQTLGTVGRWTRVERIIHTAGEATTVALGFRIMSDTNVGEMWIDDVSVEPLGGSPARGGP